MKVAYAGERGAFAELAAMEYFGKKCQYSAVGDFAAVFESVVNGNCNYGIVPIENSLAGSIHQNYDLLLESNTVITGEILLKIGHFLIANKNVKLKDLKNVFSHPQALAQCKNYLSKHKQLQAVPFSNTAAAVKKIKEEKIVDAAAIASMQAAIDFNMNILASNIEDNKWNTTRFLIISAKAVKTVSNIKDVKTSIVFSTKNIPGALFKCLAVFALRDINLFKIESRPIHGRGFQYLFYLDLEGDMQQESVRNAINHLQEITTFYRLLGSYKAGRIVQPCYNKRQVL
ncbi:MAG TPA: prephenate dehydratase [Chitinispirillaceae bacterium]|nr:prephenate dehydratase [Chitinispirillaceae bacterium]